MKYMRIGYICPNYYPDMAGGIEWYSLHITRELSNLGHEVHVFTQATKKADKPEDVIEGVRIHRLPSYGFFYRAKYWPGISKKMCKYKLDAVMSLDYAQTQTWQALRYCRKNNIPFSVLLYDIQSQKKPRAFYKQIPLDLFDRLFARRIFNKCTNIFIRTQAVIPWLKKQDIDLNKVHETPCGLTKDELTPGSPTDFYRRFGIRSQIILFLGRIRKQKGIFMLLDAFKNIQREIPDAKLVYIGPDDKDYDKLEFTTQLKEIIIKDNIKNVFILEPLYGQDKNDALAACDILVLPSSYEAFGQVFLQAMAQRKPSVGTNAGGVPFVIDNGVNGLLIEPWDQIALENALEKLLKNKNLRDNFGASGHIKAQNYFYPNLAKELEKVLFRQINY